jgi:hypothetical protein
MVVAHGFEAFLRRLFLFFYFLGSFVGISSHGVPYREQTQVE